MQVLSPLLLEEELHIIFGRVSNVFSKSLADAYARLEPLVSHTDTASLYLALPAFMWETVVLAWPCQRCLVYTFFFQKFISSAVLWMRRDQRGRRSVMRTLT